MLKGAHRREGERDREKRSFVSIGSWCILLDYLIPVCMYVEVVYNERERERTAAGALEGKRREHGPLMKCFTLNS